MTALLCGLLFISIADSAQAANSKPSDGEVSLNKIQDKTDNVASSDPRGMEEVQKEARKGLNGVQGGADKDKMISPEDTDALTVRKKVSKFLDNLTN
ncbi:MAG: hypothetical protein AAFQ80_17260 [Cyanobacteria bacterium J06621_8]